MRPFSPAPPAGLPGSLDCQGRRHPTGRRRPRARYRKEVDRCEGGRSGRQRHTSLYLTARHPIAKSGPPGSGSPHPPPPARALPASPEAPVPSPRVKVNSSSSSERRPPVVEKRGRRLATPDRAWRTVPASEPVHRGKTCARTCRASRHAPPQGRRVRTAVGRGCHRCSRSAPGRDGFSTGFPLPGVQRSESDGAPGAAGQSARPGDASRVQIGGSGAGRAGVGASPWRRAGPMRAVARRVRERHPPWRRSVRGQAPGLAGWVADRGDEAPWGHPSGSPPLDRERSVRSTYGYRVSSA